MVIALVALGFGVLILILGLVVGARGYDDGAGGALIILGGVVTVGAIMGLNAVHNYREEREQRRPEGAWCSDAGGTYYPHGVWLDGYAVQAPTCITNVEET